MNDFQRCRQTLALSAERLLLDCKLRFVLTMYRDVFLFNSIAGVFSEALNTFDPDTL